MEIVADRICTVEVAVPLTVSFDCRCDTVAVVTSTLPPLVEWPSDEKSPQARQLDELGGSRALGTTFWDLLEMAAIPRETRGYVPTFFASLIIAGDPAAYGFHISDPIDPGVKRVEVKGPLSLRFLAEKAHVGEGLLRDLNPMLRRGVVPARRMEIRVPSGSARMIAAISRKHDPYVAKQLARLMPRHRKARHGERTITGGM